MTIFDDKQRDASTDHSLVRRLKVGEEDAATELYLRYASRLQTLARAQTSPALASRFDPEDVVQSVFRTFFRRASEGLYEVPPGEELWKLLLVLALNKIRELGTFHRAQKRDVSRTHGADALELVSGASSDNEVSLHVLQMVLDELMAQLGETQREIVRLRIEGYIVDDIAGKTQRSKRTVERVLQEFRTQMSKLIDVESNP